MMSNAGGRFGLWVRALVVAVALLGAVAGPSWAQARKALVIGVDTYALSTDLQNARRDAQDMASALTGLGFALHGGRAHLDATRADILRLQRDFAGSLGASDIAVVFMAGHGVGHDGMNYFLPADDRDITHVEDLRGFAVGAEQIAEEVQRPGRAGPLVMILDMCRDRPLPSRQAGRSGSRGAVRSVEKPGVLYAFAAGPGEVASDRHPRRSNGLFTGVLLERLAQAPSQRVDDFFREVGAEVRRLNPSQNPMRAENLTNTQLFAWSGVVGTTTRPAPPAAVRAEPRWGYSALDGSAVIDGSLVSASSPAGTVFKDCASCPEMIVVPSGRFVMGSPAGEVGRQEDEGPQRTVTLPRAFGVSRTEVTRGQYAAFVDATGRGAGDQCYVRTSDAGDWGSVAGKSWRDPGYAQTDAHPVVCVSWHDAGAFANWVGSMSGVSGYRLPTEAEFEYANRAGGSGAYATSDGTASGVCGIGNGGDASLKAQYASWKWTTLPCRDGHVHTSPVGSFGKNAFGLYDLTGNVWEWVEDCYANSYSGAPNNGTARTTSDCSDRVLRGGSWYSSPQVLRSADRRWSNPVSRNYSSGFRLARTL